VPFDAYGDRVPEARAGSSRFRPDRSIGSDRPIGSGHPRRVRPRRLAFLVVASVLLAVPLAIAADGGAQSPGDPTLGSVESGVTTRPILLAFGDSVAAGYGLGPSGPEAGGASSRNQWAYSHVLADDLGWSDRNFAVEGASAGVNGVLAEICRSVGSHSVTSKGQSGCASGATPITPAPRLITVTVGADDIQFAACMIAELLTGPVFPNPCAGAELAKNLRSLAVNLERDLKILRTLYPRVPVILTGYYNPLASGNGSLLPSGCPLVSAAVLAPLLLQRNWWGLFRYAWEWHGTTAAGSAPEQNAQAAQEVSAFSRQVVARLNETLARAAGREPGVHFIQPNFGTRGLCSGSPLVFEPLAEAAVTVNAPLLGARSIRFHFGTAVCPGPKESLEKMLSHSGSGAVSLFGGQLLSYSYRLSSNCALHPTRQGQVVIAQQIRGLAERLTS
jgi:lysophospholipase L1-like esterase